MRKNPYESQRYLDEYLLFHYGRPEDLCAFDFVPRKWLRFHERLRTECLKPAHAHGHGSIRALDIGCAVGRFTFELGRVADDVLGIDSSRQFINAARKVARTGSISLRINESGHRATPRRIVVPKPAPNSIRFETVDAMKLGALVKVPFQIVAAINLLCRLPAPKKFLKSLPALVAPGGQLLLASPFSWLEEHTPRENWLSSAEVERLLRPDFRLVQRRDLPFVIREHRRKYELVVTEVTIWFRK